MKKQDFSKTAQSQLKKNRRSFPVGGGPAPGLNKPKRFVADTMLGIIHILLVIAVILLFERLIQAGNV